MKYVYIIETWGKPWMALSSKKKAREYYEKMIDISDSKKSIHKMLVY